MNQTIRVRVYRKIRDKMLGALEYEYYSKYKKKWYKKWTGYGNIHRCPTDAKYLAQAPNVRNIVVIVPYGKKGGMIRALRKRGLKVR